MILCNCVSRPGNFGTRLVTRHFHHRPADGHDILPGRIVGVEEYVNGRVWLEYVYGIAIEGIGKICMINAGLLSCCGSGRFSGWGKCGRGCFSEGRY